jgi:prepilin-type N-terminal cleavage/methylation domain-containing protein
MIRQRGVTLLELLIVVAMVGFLVTAGTSAYMSVVDADSHLRNGREQALLIPRLEDRLTNLVEHAYLSADPNDSTTYFIAGDEGLQPSSGPATTLVFTSASSELPPSLVGDHDTDFESVNADYGPLGGVEEVGLSMTPIGDAPVQDGSFIREQRPSDGDPTQGGYEKQFSAEMTDLEFEFFDGTNWLPSWDTRTMTTKRIPAAVRVTYQLNGEDDTRTLVIRLPLSDVTPTNPVTEDTAAQ